MIYNYQVQVAIDKLTNAGIDIYKDDYVLAASPDARFDESEVYPIEIVVTDIAPKGTCYLMRRADLAK